MVNIKKYLKYQSLIIILFLIISSIQIPVSAAPTAYNKNFTNIDSIPPILKDTETVKKSSNGYVEKVLPNVEIPRKRKINPLTQGEQPLIPDEKSAKIFIEENKSSLGVSDVTKELKLVETKRDEIGHTFVKFSQIINGIPVYGNNITVHYDQNGKVKNINGKLDKNKVIKTVGNDNLSENEAIEIAKKEFSFNSLRNTPTAEKFILNKDNSNYEVYKINISFLEPYIGNYDVFVEAHSGKIIHKVNRIRADGPVIGTGLDIQGNTKQLNLYQTGSLFVMKDSISLQTSDISTFDMNNSINIYNASLVSNQSNNFTSESTKGAVSAHYNASRVIDFYKNLFNRNSLDDRGMQVRSYTNFGTNYNNAFWNGYEMVYGSGDGIQFTHLSGDLDIVGHEMTHAVIENSADLYYSNQSGALNESVADLFGVLIETYDKYDVAKGGNWVFDPADWIVGDKVYTPNINGDALRSLANPSLYNQPDNMNNYNNMPDTEEGDFGGVHTNSGIPNKAAFLVAQTIGMEKTAKIYYRALTYYFGMFTDFSKARDSLVQAASDLYGQDSLEVSAINTSFDTVGIYSSLVIDPYEINDSMTSAYPITVGNTYESYISSENDLDFYQVAVDTKSLLIINLSNLPKDYDLYLISSDGSLIDYSENLYQLQENIVFLASPGTKYYILVGSYSGSSVTQKYALKVTVSNDLYEPNDSMASAYPINLGTTYSSYINTLKDNDYYRFDINSVGHININLSNLPKNYNLYLYNSSGFEIKSSINSANESENINYYANTGTYYIRVAPNGNYSPNENYSLTVTKYVSGVSLSERSITLNVGDNINLSANITPIDATNKNVTWTSSNESIATVDSNGKVTAVGENGKTTITVKTEDGGYLATCTVYVLRLPRTVTFDSLGGTYVSPISTNSFIGNEPPRPYKRGHEFAGWYKDLAFTDRWDFSTNYVYSDMTLYAKWNIESYTVEFDSNSWIEVLPITTEYNKLITEPKPPIMLGYTFLGWYKDPQMEFLWDFNKDVVSNNRTLYAKWIINSYKVTFDSQGGSLIPSIVTNYNTLIKEPIAPTRSGYTFKGWYKDLTFKELWGFTYNAVNKPITLYAKWVVTTPTVPAAVKSLSSAYNSIIVEWSPVIGANGYEVYRSPWYGGVYTLITNTTLDITKYKNIGLVTNELYCYKIRAYRLVGSTKAYSNYSTATCAKPIPSAPTSARAVSSAYNSIKTSWSPVSGASGYSVYRSTTSSGTYSIVSDTTSTSFMNTGLTTNKLYYYKVRAYRLVGSTKVYSNYSTAISAKPIPSAPTARAVSSAYNSIKTSWAPVSGASGYLVYRSTSSNGTYSIVSNTTSTSFINTGLITNKLYYYKVRAYRLLGSTKVYSNYSTTISSKPIPSSPQRFKATRGSSTSIKLTWIGVKGASGYEIYRSTAPNRSYSLIKRLNTLNFTNTRLIRGRTYYYKIRAYRLVGTTKIYSNWSKIVYTRTY
ncbi:MAG: Extracellular neutral metalloprotease, fused to ChW-repeat [Bacillales bacterium]|nr:Extracellular neutral metalloprotease, fused to ChW-repeat [Bacillales bacterium]